MLGIRLGKKHVRVARPVPADTEESGRARSGTGDMSNSDANSPARSHLRAGYHVFHLRWR